MIKSNEEAAQKVQDLLEVKTSRLSTWEIDFISNMESLEEFSDGQIIKIDELWEKYCNE